MSDELLSACVFVEPRLADERDGLTFIVCIDVCRLKQDGWPYADTKPFDNVACSNPLVAHGIACRFHQVEKHTPFWFAGQMMKDYIKARDANTCQYCGKVCTVPRETCVDHIRPARDVFGLDTKIYDWRLWAYHSPANLVVACRGCNSGKGTRDIQATHDFLVKRGTTPMSLEQWHPEVARNDNELFYKAMSLVHMGPKSEASPMLSTK